MPPSGDSPATTATNATATASTAADAATTRRGTPPTVGGPARRPAAANAGAATKAAACAGAAPHRVCPSSRAGGGRTRAVRVGTWRHGGTLGGDRCCHLRRRWQGEAYVQALALDPLAPLKRHIKDLGLFLGGHAQRLAQKGNLRVNLEPRVLGVHVVPRPRRELDNPFRRPPLPDPSAATTPSSVAPYTYTSTSKWPLRAGPEKRSPNRRALPSPGGAGARPGVSPPAASPPPAPSGGATCSSPHVW